MSLQHKVTYVPRSHAQRGSGSNAHGTNNMYCQAERGNEDVLSKQENKNGYFLQLDIKNFFYSINRKILLNLIFKQLSKSIKKHKTSKSYAKHCYGICHAILTKNNWHDSRPVNKSQLNNIPAHKRLINAPLDTGLPIGNLSSQFFANVYLNQLDQFVKHDLKCKYYIRYVDDFILLHQSQSQLNQWHTEIVDFLANKLLLSIKPAKVKNISNGADFLGYIIRPHYKLVRKRVIGNLYEKLTQIEKLITTDKLAYLQSGSINPNIDRNRPLEQRSSDRLIFKFTIQQLNQLQAILASYWGHFKHANHWRLQNKISKKFNWLTCLFQFNNDSVLPLWQANDSYSFATQVQYFQNQYPNAVLKIQKGNRFNIYQPKHANNHTINCSSIIQTRSHVLRGSVQDTQVLTEVNTPMKSMGTSKKNMLTKVKQITVIQHGYLKSGLRNRIINSMTIQL